MVHSGVSEPWQPRAPPVSEVLRQPCWQRAGPRLAPSTSRGLTRGLPGEDIGTVQYGWPLCMPLVRKLEPGLWEFCARTSPDGIARVLFTVEGQTMILLHGFAKKGRKTPTADLRTAQQRRADLARESDPMNKNHVGGDFDDFLREEGLLADVQAVATKRVVALQIAQEMERCHITHSELARRMNTSRSAVKRLLDPANPAVTLSTLERAASAVGKRLTVQLTA